MTRDGRLASINVTNEDQRARLFSRIDFHERALINFDFFFLDHSLDDLFDRPGFRFAFFALSTGLTFALLLSFALIFLRFVSFFAFAVSTKRAISISIFSVLVVIDGFFIIIILLTGLGVAIAVSIIVGLISHRCHLLNAVSLSETPVEDILWVERVLWVVLVHKKHLFFGRLAIDGEKGRFLALGRQSFQLGLLFRVNFSLRRSLLLLFGSGAKSFANIGIIVGEANHTFGHEGFG